MKISKKATSIAEAIVVTLIIATGLVGVYKIYNESNELSNGVKNKIQAIQIAREGIEAFTNIRDTNWVSFPSNYDRCWNTYNLNSSCITDTDTTKIIKNSNTYKIFKNSNNKWILDFPNPSLSNTGYTDNDYRNYYKVNLNQNGLYTQTGSIGTNGVTDLRPIYIREININYLDSPSGNDNYQKMEVTSKVTWSDNSSNKLREVELNSILNNWKNKKN